jgi:hypothetical protein
MADGETLAAAVRIMRRLIKNLGASMPGASPERGAMPSAQFRPADGYSANSFRNRISEMRKE